MRDMSEYLIETLAHAGFQHTFSKDNLLTSDKKHFIISVRESISQNILLYPLYFWGFVKESLSSFLPKNSEDIIICSAR